MHKVYLCKCCKKMKEDTAPVKLMHGTYTICPACKEELKWTTTILRMGARKAASEGTHTRISALQVAQL